MTKDKIDKLKINLKTLLESQLPGSNAQHKMAPIDRQGEFYGIDKKDAAVLILIYPKNNTFYTVFIKRNNYDGPHSGQISFPGGKFDKKDITLENTALRETQEEIGIDAGSITLVGKLTQLYIPISKFEVSPFVAVANSIPDFKIDSHEVQYLIETPIKNLIFRDHAEVVSMKVQNKKIPVPCFIINGEQVWGATAMILNEFIEILKSKNFDSSFLQ